MREGVSQTRIKSWSLGTGSDDLSGHDKHENFETIEDGRGLAETVHSALSESAIEARCALWLRPDLGGTVLDVQQFLPPACRLSKEDYCKPNPNQGR
jgi:hypothetical protein